MEKLNNPWVKKRNNKENVKVFDPNENKSTTYKNLWAAAKAILKGKFIE